MASLVLTAVADDRAGLVDQLTQLLADQRANVADSRMIHLAGRFAIVMLIQIADDHADALKQNLPPAAAKLGLSLTLSDADKTSGGGAGVPYRIRTYAMDQVGLVHRITHVLASHQINIEDLSTRLEHGPHTGTPLFSMDMIVTIPPQVPLKQIRNELEQLCAELNCDLDIDRT
ncbi:MAG: glycine cleavage system transcriptional repressor [Phycisphaerales bacterium]